MAVIHEIAPDILTEGTPIYLYIYKYKLCCVCESRDNVCVISLWWWAPWEPAKETNWLELSTINRLIITAWFNPSNHAMVCLIQMHALWGHRCRQQTTRQRRQRSLACQCYTRAHRDARWHGSTFNQSFVTRSEMWVPAQWIITKNNNNYSKKTGISMCSRERIRDTSYMTKRLLGWKAGHNQSTCKTICTTDSIGLT